jgi:hypothetical protein
VAEDSVIKREICNLIWQCDYSFDSNELLAVLKARAMIPLQPHPAIFKSAQGGDAELLL